MEQAGVQLIAAGGDVYISTITNATKATNTFVDATDKGSGRVSGAGQVMIGALRKVGEIAVSALADAAKATAAFVGDSIGLAGDFEAGMLSFQAVAGKDVDTKGLEQFRDLFLQIGKELPVSTADVQKAAIEMIKGGIDPAIVAAGGLRQNIQFAAAAMDGDLVAAAEISSKILGGWASASATAQEKADFLTHSTDLLTKAANASAVDVKGLSLGIFNAQGIAKTAGVSFDDLTTTLAELAPRFASSSEAGTSLKNLIARLQPTTKPAIAAMQGLGLMTEDGKNKFYDATGAFVGFESASQLLQDSLKGLTKQQQASILQTIFGNDAMSAASALAELGASGYTNMADAMAKANGVAENAALKQQGFNTALDNAKGSVEALQITIGSALLPILTDLLNNVVAPAVNTLTDMADALNGNDEAFNRLSPTLQGFVSVISNLGGYFSAVVEDGDYLNDFLTNLPAPIQGVVGGVGMLVAAFGPFQQYIAAVVDDGDTLNDFLTDIPKPMRGVVQATGEIVSWFGQAGDAGDSLSGVLEDLNGIWNKALVVVTDVGDGYLAIAQSILPIVSKFWSDHGTEITAFLQTAYDKIIRIVNVALDLYDAIVPKVLGSVADWIDKHATGIQAVLAGAWDAISGIIDGALTLIEGTLKIALDLIHGDWSKAWTDLQTMSATFVLDLEQVIEGFLNIIAGFFNTSLQEIADLWQHNWDALYEIATQTDWVQVGEDVINGILQGINDNASKLMSTLKNLAGDALQAAKDALGISSPSTEFAAVGQFAVEGIMQGFVAMWPALMESVSTLADDLVSQAADIGSAVQDAIAEGFGATASIDRQKLSNIHAMEDIDAVRRAGVQAQLDEAEKVALAMNDPQAAAAYFRMRSKQIVELGQLNDQINAATNAKEREALIAQYQLVNAAQQAELHQFDAQQAGATSPAQALVDQISSLLQNGLGSGPLADSGLGDTFMALLTQLETIIGLIPHRAGGGAANAGQPYWVGEHGPELFWPQTNGMVSPAASSAQLARSASTTNYSTTYNNTMPIYTNNSPGALQQSWAVMQASMT